MQVTIDNISSYYTDFDNFESKLLTLKNDCYNSSTTSSYITASQVDFGTWDDEISAKLKANTEELGVTVLPNIEKSIDSDFTKLYNLSKDLNDEVDRFKGYNSTYNSITKKQAEDDEEKKKKKKTADTNRKSSITKINKILTDMSNISYNGSTAPANNNSGGWGNGYVPPKPDYEAWNKGMYGDGYWNPDGTHNEGKGGFNYGTTFRGQDNVTVNGKTVKITAVGLNPGQANTGAAQTETVSFNATTLDNGMIYLQGENGLNYIYNPNTHAFYDVTGHGQNGSNAPADIMSKYSGADAGDLLFQSGGNESASGLLGWSIGMRNQGYYNGQGVGVGTQTY